jgi:ADP-ribose pyrophosphatase YjhB (NUDIX family)
VWFCDECGVPTQGGDPAASDPPVCATHGPRWRLVRNVPCAAAVIVRDGRVLLARRAKAPFLGYWEVPGGFVERGEHPTEAAVREAREELGITITLTGLIGSYLELSGFGEDLLITAYEARTDDPEPVANPHEVSEWAWVAPADFPPADAMAGRHRIRLDDWCAGRTVPLPGDGLG